MERRFLCKECRHVFDLEVSSETSPDIPACSLDKKVCCPACGSTDVMETPVWAPLTSGWNIFESNEWEYECQQCKHIFKLPTPKSPAEDESRRCPACNSGQLRLLTGGKALPLHCG
jgi:rubredoxin/DNA-directed RNA polymerase subunit RPC12/RpoP